LFVANVGSAQSKGVEVEINFKPVSALLLTASGSYTHAQYQSIDAAFAGAAAVQPGDAVPDVPPRKLNLGAEYTIPIAMNASYLRLDWSHLGSVPTGFTYHDVRPAYSALEAAVGFRTERYDISLYGHNLTNSTGILSIQEGSTYSYGEVFRSEIATPPRTVGIDLKMHF
jgi:iron complex outermembrane receptor protein